MNLEEALDRIAAGSGFTASDRQALRLEIRGLEASKARTAGANPGAMGSQTVQQLVVTGDLDVPAGRVLIGQAVTGKGNILLNAAGIKLRRGLIPKIDLQTDGDVLIGTDTRSPSTTNVAIFTVDQTYNSESLGASDLLLGDNSSGKGNLFWDFSAGTLALRVGTTAKITLDTGGTISLSGKLLMSGASSAIAIGSTPPTSASAGTGIWLDRTGLYGLLSNTVQAKLDAATGAITAGAGTVVLDVNGIGIGGSGEEFVMYDSTTFASNKVGKVFWSPAAGSVSTITISSRGVSGHTEGILHLEARNFAITGDLNLDLVTITTGAHSYGSFYTTTGTFDGIVIDGGSAATPNAKLDVRGGIISTSLTSGRVAIVSTGGLLADDADLTFSGSTLTATNMAVTTALTAGTVAAGTLGTTDGIVINALMKDGQVYSRSNDASSNIVLHVRPSSGKDGWLTFTEDSVADRWAMGVVAADSLLYWKSTTPAGTTRMTLSTAGALTVTGAFGCNTKAAQAAFVSGGAAPAGGTGATAGAYDTAAHRDSLITLVNNIRSALVANGIMS